MHQTLSPQAVLMPSSILHSPCREGEGERAWKLRAWINCLAFFLSFSRDLAFFLGPLPDVTMFVDVDKDKWEIKKTKLFMQNMSDEGEKFRACQWTEQSWFSIAVLLHTKWKEKLYYRVSYRRKDEAQQQVGQRWEPIASVRHVCLASLVIRE